MMMHAYFAVGVERVMINVRIYICIIYGRAIYTHSTGGNRDVAETNEGKKNKNICMPLYKLYAM